MNTVDYEKGYNLRWNRGKVLKDDVNFSNADDEEFDISGFDFNVDKIVKLKTLSDSADINKTIVGKSWFQETGPESGIVYIVVKDIGKVVKAKAIDGSDEGYFRKRDITSDIVIQDCSLKIELKGRR